MWWIVVGVQIAIVAGSLARLLVARARVRRLTVIPRFDPPADVDAATAAVILRRRRRAGVAAILEQAVAGAIWIRRTEHGTYRAVFRRPFDGERGLSLQTAIFGTSVGTGDVASIGPRAVRSTAQLVSLRMWSVMLDNQPVLRGRQTPGVIVPVAGIALGLLAFIVALLDAEGDDVSETGAWWAVLTGFFLTSAVACVALLIATMATPSAALGAARAHLAGLRMFMDWAEADRLRMLQSPTGATERDGVLRLYERLLPYAVAMGIERDWARVVALVSAAPPAWFDAGYSGFVAGSVGVDGGFSADGFANSVGEMCDGGAGDSGTGGDGGSGGIGFGGSDGSGGGDGGSGGGGDGGGGGGGGGD